MIKHLHSIIFILSVLFLIILLSGCVKYSTDQLSSVTEHTITESSIRDKMTIEDVKPEISDLVEKENGLKNMVNQENPLEKKYDLYHSFRTSEENWDKQVVDYEDGAFEGDVVLRVNGFPRVGVMFFMDGLPQEVVWKDPKATYVSHYQSISGENPYFLLVEIPPNMQGKEIKFPVRLEIQVEGNPEICQMAMAVVTDPCSQSQVLREEHSEIPMGFRNQFRNNLPLIRFQSVPKPIKLKSIPDKLKFVSEKRQPLSKKIREKYTMDDGTSQLDITPQAWFAWSDEQIHEFIDKFYSESDRKRLHDPEQPGRYLYEKFRDQFALTMVDLKARDSLTLPIEIVGPPGRQLRCLFFLDYMPLLDSEGKLAPKVTLKKDEVIHLEYELSLRDLEDETAIQMLTYDTNAWEMQSLGGIRSLNPVFLTLLEGED